MIPAFDAGGVLPPFLGTSPGMAATQSPFDASPLELVQRFGTTPRRNEFLRGLLNYRAALRAIDLIDGFQWIDGSFVENKEARLGLSPGDIDLVTVFERPAHVSDTTSWLAHAGPHVATLFDPGFCKATYHCEAFSIDLGAGGQAVARLSSFWFGLFSHQRVTYRWKGVVLIPLGPDPIDQLASDELSRRGF